MKKLMTATYDGLTNEELAVLARYDEEALEKLIRQNEGFTVFMASNFLEQSNCYDHYRLNFYEDYTQICRISVMKAVKNYNPGSGIKFISYAGRIMRNDMLRQLKKDEDYREKMTDILTEENDTVAEECDEEYGDAYDDRFEDNKTDDLDILPSSAFHVSKEPVMTTQETADEGASPAGLDWYAGYMQGIPEGYAETLSTDSQEKKDHTTTTYESCKETGYSWQSPIYYKALKNLQTETVIQELFDESFDAAQREYLIYRYGLMSLMPKKQKAAAEHFHLSVSYARKIEKIGLAALKNKLQIEHWL